MLHTPLAFQAWVIHYAHTYLSDFEFRLMCQTQNVNTKKDQEQAAVYMGHSSTATLTKTLRDLEERGLVILEKYKIDWTPLNEKCYALALGKEPPTIEAPVKEKGDNEMHALYWDMKKVAPTFMTGGKWAWINGKLPELSEVFQRETLIDFMEWSELLYSHTNNGNVKGGIKPYDDVSFLIKMWQENGSPMMAPFDLYEQMKAIAGEYLKGDYERWVVEFLPELEAEFSHEDILGTTKYMTNYYKDVPPKKFPDTRGIYYNSIKGNIIAWINGGRKAVYSIEENRGRDFSGI